MVYRLNISGWCHWETIFWLCYFKITVITRYRKWSLHVLWNPRAWVYSLKNKGLPLKNFVKSKTGSTRKLSNSYFIWSKILYQNNLKNIASFFTFFKHWRCNKSSVVTPKKISHGSLRKWVSNFTRIVITQVKFWKFYVQDVILLNLTFIFFGSDEKFFWCYYRWFIASLALEKCKKECIML